MKKTVKTILLSFCIASLPIFIFMVASAASHADINGDGVLNTADLPCLMKLIAAGDNDLSHDLNGDGAVNIKDLIRLMKKLASGETLAPATSRPDEVTEPETTAPITTTPITTAPTAPAPDGDGYLVALTNQGQSTLEVHDISEGRLDSSSLVWSYKADYYNIAGAKLRNCSEYGDVALFVCGSSHGYMVSYPEGELLWSTSNAAANPHSIELMPNGIIAIASSTGNEIRFFSPTQSFSFQLASVKLTDAHGVLWDDINQLLWAIGGDLLTAYRVTLNGYKLTVSEDSSRRVVIPTDNAHDLAPVYGNPDLLWITTGSKVYQFNKRTESFSVSYAGNEWLNRKNVKGVGNFSDGSICYIYPDGAFESWTSRSIMLIRCKNGEMVKEKLTSDSGHFYKIRVWDTAYQ